MVSRYLLPATVLLAPFGFAALDHLRNSRGSFRLPWLPTVLFLFLALQNVLILYRVALPSTRSFTRGIEHSLIYIGEWFEKNTPERTTIAVPDIGAIGYYSHRRIIDLSGLVTPEMIAPQAGMSIDEFVESLGFASVARPDYLVDRYTSANRFATEVSGFDPESVRDSVPAGLLKPIFHRKIGPLGIARSNDFYYTVYRIDWDRYPRAN